jgi:hypothetical protein
LLGFFVLERFSVEEMVPKIVVALDDVIKIPEDFLKS